MQIYNSLDEVKEAGTIAPDSIINADCLEAMKFIPDNSIDLICTKSLYLSAFQRLYGKIKESGQCCKHPRNDNLISVGHMNILQDFEGRICPVCGKEYQANLSRLKHGRQTTCSRECSYKLRGENASNTLERKRLAKPASSLALSQCKKCGADFKPRCSTSSFCSKTCSVKSRPNFLENQVCAHCGTEYKPPNSKSKYCNHKCFSESHQARMQGENNPSWLDGRSYEKRCHRGHDWEAQRHLAYKRDSYTCQRCKVHCVGRRGMREENAHTLIQCHHIVFWKDSPDNSLENLITLCVSCHAKLHFGNIDINEPK